MEPLAAHPPRCSGPKAKVLAVLLSMALCTGTLFLLQLKLLQPKSNSFYAFEVKDAKGRPVSLEKFKGKILQRRNQDGISGNIWSTLRVES
ncbi:probable glutathione peroxidase 8 isoform X3 [Molossus molossus]|uniref:probable glutathione peroxidase 8 isoform X3 n=1 Tax=Molossus molossus TaxID=27622 RepID=UPI0017479892|nr:probable glutathione peroxidase 8 isoform X3 [Molossus molossus]